MLTLAPAKASSVHCGLFAVLARKAAGGGPRIPSSLNFMRRELADDQFVAYQQFQLLERRELTLSKAQRQGSARFSKSGHSLRLRLLETDARRFKLNATLLGSASQKALVNVDYWTGNSGGVMIYVGGRHADGRMIFATQCSVR